MMKVICFIQSLLVEMLITSKKIPETSRHHGLAKLTHKSESLHPATGAVRQAAPGGNTQARQGEEGQSGPLKLPGKAHIPPK